MAAAVLSVYNRSERMKVGVRPFLRVGVEWPCVRELVIVGDRPRRDTIVDGGKEKCVELLGLG
jgi:hypothetical protein